MAVKAYVLIEAVPGASRDVAARAQKIDGVKSVSVVTGPHDVIAVVETTDAKALGDLLITKIQKIDGKKETGKRRDGIMISEITEKLLFAKKQKGLSFADLEKIVNHDEVWIAALFYRQARASQEEATKIADALALGSDVVEALTEYPIKGLGPVVPTDPLIYRFYEIMQVYGMPLKAVIHEKFGDGIMSAIDFTMDVDKEEDPKGDRVRITMSGKFLPYKKW